jgi:2-dehydro-3-deoxyphosphogluconate aldolase / (4S)-4-hydroxy-2-oxoglutarate aldolase
VTDQIVSLRTELSASRAVIGERLAAARVIPVATIDDGEQARSACRALAQGGISCIEITFRTARAVEALRAAREVQGMLVGAGTVLSADQVVAAAEAGAHFAVAPGLNERVVDAAVRQGLPFFPGVATPSEIELARSLGLRVVKVFPASIVGGPAFLRAVSVTYPDVRFIPTGGITFETLPDYLAVPSVLAVGGSWLVKEDMLRAGRLDEVTRLAAQVTAVRA